MRKGMGWKSDQPDHRDHIYAAAPETISNLSIIVDLRPQCPPIWDQLDISSCTSCAVGACIQFDQIKQGIESFMPSRLFIYYNERDIEGDGSVNYDSGGEIRDAIKAVVDDGVCPETMWAYEHELVTVHPTGNCYTEAAKHPAVTYQRINQDLTQLKSCLAEGYPIAFGISIFESMESEAVARTGYVPLPTMSESSIGGHAVVLVGFDDTRQWFIVRNSWGKDFGVEGYMFLPYAYVLNPGLADDFWTIKLVQ